ncbi:thioredoxin domain-containing protein, partial [Thermovenabulum sp.]|uniref:thioredoxin domain-containing protein n=1 Tax=Thermovenabulum sp. TaxID=3100335 RepID=UPI003C7B848C
MNIDSKKANRLINEKSPYLLQHAYNPVDWYPWGEEAFERARAEDKLIFLSIGYSTCHWCHVMERESFEDKEIGDLLNRYYISVKVDREEHPDVDNFYMEVCQAFTGSGGWPLTIIMTPSKYPIFAATYLPKEDSFGRPGLKTVLLKINELWQKEKERLIVIGKELVSSINDFAQEKYVELNTKVIEKAYEILLASYDRKYGGFFGAPKFPMASTLLFLLGYYEYKKDPMALEMVKKTLINMYKGGIYDHIGFGLCRYSTDKIWLVPHFEKMLYDNALIAYVCAETFKITKDEFFKTFCVEIIDYVLRNLKNPEGGFYTAEDADSEGEEGKFYIWTLQEIKDILGEKANEFIANYNITEKGNFEGKNIPNLIGKDLSCKMDENIRRKLFEYREKRTKPFRDEKILVSNNSLMICALFKAFGITKNDVYRKEAETTLKFILENTFDTDGRLHVGFKDGPMRGKATFDDYIYLIWSLIEAYEYTLDRTYILKAKSLLDETIELFYHNEEGGFFLTGKDVEHLPIRTKEVYDGAVPSGNSVAAYSLIRLSRLFFDHKIEEIAQKQFKVFGSKINKNPVSYTFFLYAFLYNLKGTEVVISGNNPKIFTEYLMSNFLPYTVWAYADDLKKIVPAYENYQTISGNTAAYVYKNGSCKSPVTTL